MNRKCLLPALIIFLSICGAAFATPTPPQNVSSAVLQNPLGLYAGIQPGYAHTNYSRSWLTSHAGFTSADSVDNRGFAARFFMGYEANRFVSAELGYIYLPRILYNNINNAKVNDGFREQLVDLVAKLTLPMGPVGLFVKGGGAYLHRSTLTTTVDGARLNTNTSDSTYTAAAGAGISLKLYQHFYADLSYLYYFKNSDFKSVQFYGLALGVRV